jgi:cytochrome P450
MEIYKASKRDEGTFEKTRPNFLDMMLQLNESDSISFQHLREEMDTIAFAGHDTTAHNISWAIWCLAHHPEIQQRIYDELIQHFGETDSEFSSIKLKQCRYLGMVLKEVLRLYPPVPFIQRTLHNELQMCDKTLPRGASITIPLIVIHRNPKIFKDPLKFDPERFADGKDYPVLSYVPFSAGPRNCIGQKFAIMEAKITLAHLVYNFKFDTDVSLEDNKFFFEVILRPSLGIPVKLTKRVH